MELQISMQTPHPQILLVARINKSNHPESWASEMIAHSAGRRQTRACPLAARQTQVRRKRRAPQRLRGLPGLESYRVPFGVRPCAVLLHCYIL